ncbi:FtsW/RodA/SpoVE family cell cycle protein [Clostridium sp. YIM B02515]|uniref:FtsW/RodA/SpoVE family cell cycle protein n=1 Tax=Clostridium rhizosphaerae TaxID=2803861 RepID=A0ABS1TAC7_9CLOT|nr:FtsW/RodA/SpoVE family cell cycle protein [Clostridium rhizosphaerae]
MDSIRDEKKLLRYTYLLCLVCFFNVALLKPPFDKGAMIISVIMIILIAYSHFIVRRFYPDGDKHIFVFASILSVIGIATLYRIDLAMKTTFAIKQVMWFALGVAAFIIIVVLLPDLKRFQKYKYAYMVLTLIFMSISLLFGAERGGAKNWIIIGGFSLQPAEFGKLFMVAYLASVLKDYKDFKSLIEPAIVIMVCLGFMVMQKDLGTALIIFGLSVTMLYIATSKFKYVITCLILFMAGGFISYKLFGHIRIRFAIWQNPWPYATEKGLQIVQSLIAIAWGGLFGKGLGFGFPQYIPVRESDFIFTVICEELGIVAGLGIIIIYFLLFYRSMRAAVYVENNFSRLIAVGYSAVIASQALVILGGVINLIPLTGITLPLISYGGTSMLITFCSLGIVQKISEGE